VDVEYSPDLFTTQIASWTWNVPQGSFVYYRCHRSVDVVRIQFYIEQGNEIATEDQGRGPNVLWMELPEGVVAAAPTQGSFVYTVEPNYNNFRCDGLVSVAAGGTRVRLNRVDGADWPLGSNLAFWGEFEFAAEV
jgi:hypothetical protein